MFRIGEFSRIGCVTIDTLRHYDEIGLLKPATVDRFTSYRYYSANQLKSLNRIVALKDIGVSLEEIARILRENLTTDELRGMLKAQLVLAESTIEATQLRRERILARLNYLTMEEDMPAYEVTLKSVEALTIAAIRETVLAVEHMPQRCGEMFNAIAAWMSANGLPIGSPMTIYHNESYTKEKIDTECAFIVPDIEIDKIPEPDSPILVRQMEAIPNVATTIVTEVSQEIESLKPAYYAIGKWIEDHDYRIVCAPRELYHGSPDTKDLTIEIQFPVEKV